MTATRQAILRCTRELILAVLPEGRSVLDLDGVADESGERFRWLAEAMKLPANAAITGVSAHAYFLKDEIAVRIACEDFVQTQPGNCLPEVAALYRAGAAGAAFDGWAGPAVRTDLGAARPEACDCDSIDFSGVAAGAPQGPHQT